ncbi:MAG TPA: hypothetical protein VFU24_16195 [Burkholderiales bacterium]|nr:hypothetical protein [Burkholderiales bacterium]
MFEYEMEQPEAPEYDDDLEFEEAGDLETAEEIERLARCVHAARFSGA